jgi:hypothetical protein
VRCCSRLAKVCKTVVITSTTDRIEARAAELALFPETIAVRPTVRPAAAA